MASKLPLTTQSHLRRLRAPHRVGPVKAGVGFPGGEANINKLSKDSDPETKQDAGLGLTELFPRTPVEDGALRLSATLDEASAPSEIGPAK